MINNKKIYASTFQSEHKIADCERMVNYLSSEKQLLEPAAALVQMGNLIPISFIDIPQL